MFSKNISRINSTLQPLYWSIEILIMAMSLGLSWDAQQFSLAQQPPSPQAETTPAKTEELEINVYGDRLLSKPIYSPLRKEGTLKDSTRPAYVIDKNEIKAQGARTVRDAIQSLPGILGAGTVGTEVNALSGQYIRGSNSSQVLILLDGRPINNIGSGGFDLGEFSTSIVDRIEVLPGGGSTLYGSDAISGIINIVTSRPTSDKLAVGTQVEVGDLGYTKLGVNVSKKDGNIGWLIGYDRIQANNNYRYSIPSANFNATNRPNNDATYNNLRVRADVDVSDRTKVNFTGIVLSKNQGVSGGVPIPTPQFGQGFFNTLTDANRKYNDQILLDLGIEQKLGNGTDSTLTSRVYYDNLSTRFDSRTASAEALTVTNGQVVKSVSRRLNADGEARSWGIQFWNGGGEKMMTIFLPNAFIGADEDLLPEHKPDLAKLGLYDRLRQIYVLGTLDIPYESNPLNRPYISVCRSSRCNAGRDWKPVHEALEQQLKESGSNTELIVSGCLEVCKMGPIVFYSGDDRAPENTWYARVTPDVAKEIVTQHIVENSKVTKHLYPQP